jgi:hypothetical protein
METGWRRNTGHHRQQILASNLASDRPATKKSTLIPGRQNGSSRPPQTPLRSADWAHRRCLHTRTANVGVSDDDAALTGGRRGSIAVSRRVHG